MHGFGMSSGRITFILSFIKIRQLFQAEMRQHRQNELFTSQPYSFHLFAWKVG
jgi:hypothetical protein